MNVLNISFTIFTYLTNKIFCGVRKVRERIIAIIKRILRRIFIIDDEYSIMARINRGVGIAKRFMSILRLFLYANNRLPKRIEKMI